MARKEGMSNEDIVAFLGKETSFKGVITYNGAIRIDGKVEGEIISQGALVVGESADIRAEVSVGSLVCAGAMTGNIQVAGKVHLQPTATLNGSLATPVLVIDEGVSFNCQCVMKQNPAEKEAP